MKRCHFNSWVAKLLLFPTYTAVTLLYNSFFKKDGDEYSMDDINHECIHQVQQMECSVIGLVLGLVLYGLFNLSLWWIIILGLGFFYIWYGIEYLIILCFAKWDKQNERYHDVSFEEEAHNNDGDWDYLEDRKPFAWIKYIKLRSYKK
nr:MAG TPA: hypothetical protein [Caudoviricetes sp.]